MEGHKTENTPPQHKSWENENAIIIYAMALINWVTWTLYSNVLLGIVGSPDGL